MILLLSLACLLAGTFILKNIRIGAVAGILVQVLYVVLGPGWGSTQTNAVVNGVAITLELSLLLFGAVAFYRFLLNNQRLAFLDEFVVTSPDRPYLLITYCFFLGTFFEGIAGFGVPPILLIPLLAKSGFKPLTSIAVALSGSLNGVIFGALGAPLIFGLGITELNETINIVMVINALSCLAMPFILTYLYSKIEGVAVSWSTTLPMHLGAGIIYYVLFFIGSRFTVEYPSVITGAVGMILFMTIYNPAVRTWGLKFWITSFWPYCLLIAFLLMSKLILGTISFTMPGGTKSLSAYQPGLVFLITIAVISLIFKISHQQFQAKEAIEKSAQRTVQSTLTILALIIFSQLVRWEMVDYIGVFIAHQPEYLEPYLIMSFGVLGAFLTGSATMSNLLLNGLLTSATTNVTLATAVLHSGSVAGNAIALQNIVMARSAVDEPIHDREVFRYTSRTLLICLLCVSISAAVWLLLN
ncbi:L-lactate permease [Chryseolinea sp. T2]|uniref:L-lactate permease n=1 Tax=Chryseolinea sp. T2 TaxID=3129255 RepID=UPI003076DEFA